MKHEYGFMCVYANRLIVRYRVSKYENASRSLAHYNLDQSKLEYTRCTRVRRHKVRTS